MLCLPIAAFGLGAFVQQQPPEPNGREPRDAVVDGQTHKSVPPARPEQRKTDHDRSPVFESKNAPANSADLKAQPKEGKNPGFDFYKDALGSERPNMTFEEIMAKDREQKPKV